MPAAEETLRRPMRVRSFDVFMATNAVLFCGMLGLVYRSLALKYMAEAEYYIYIAALTVAGLAVWGGLRRFEFPLWLYVLFEVGLLAHFAGGLVRFGPEMARLYDHRLLFDLRFDKVVHFYNSFAGAVALDWMVRRSSLELRGARPYIIAACVLAVGSLIEIVEFIALVTLPVTGVGLYANNMGDLLANLLGAALGVTLGARLLLRGVA